MRHAHRPQEQPLQVPGIIEGDSWKLRAALCGLLSLVPLISLIAITAGNHGGFSQNLLRGIVITSVSFVLLAVAVPYRLWKTRLLGLTLDGVTVHNFWRSQDIAWDDIAEVVVTKRAGEGPTWYFPTVRLRNGRERRISGLGSANSELSAQRAAEKLVAALDIHRSGSASWGGETKAAGNH